MCYEGHIRHIVFRVGLGLHRVYYDISYLRFTLNHILLQISILLRICICVSGRVYSLESGEE